MASTTAVVQIDASKPDVSTVDVGAHVLPALMSITSIEGSSPDVADEHRATDQPTDGAALWLNEKPVTPWFSPSVNDLSDLIGFAATAALCHAYGGARVSIPSTIDESHRIARLFIGIGEGIGPALTLAQTHGGEAPHVPVIRSWARLTNTKRVATLCNQNMSINAIADFLGKSRAWVGDRRTDAISIGLVKGGVS